MKKTLEKKIQKILKKSDPNIETNFNTTYKGNFVKVDWSIYLTSQFPKAHLLVADDQKVCYIGSENQHVENFLAKYQEIKTNLEHLLQEYCC